MNRMDIEVIKVYFYEKDIKKDLFLGTAHIRLKDYDIDLKGVYFKKRKDYWFVSLPALISTHPETKKKVRYPFFSFPNREKNRDFELQVKQIIYKYMMNNIASKVVES